MRGTFSIAFIVIFPATLGLECYECFSTIEQSRCTYSRQCGPGELCGFSSSGPHYGFHCISKSVCSGLMPNFVQPIGRRKRSFGYVHCCDTNLCNRDLVSATEQPPTTTRPTTVTTTTTTSSAPSTTTTHLSTQHTNASILTSSMKTGEKTTHIFPPKQAITTNPAMASKQSPPTCENHSECMWITGKFDVCQDEETAIQICPRMCDKCDALSSHPTTEVIQPHLDQNCMDMPLCDQLLGVIAVCMHDETASRICPRTCDRCGHAQSTTPQTSASTMPSTTCKDSSVHCNLLNRTLDLCRQPKEAVYIGCSKTCGLCNDGCSDSEICLELSSKINVCSNDVMSDLLCPKMCDRCNDTSTQTIPEMTSSVSCQDTSSYCAHLNSTLKLCNYQDTAINIGCMRFCGLCSENGGTTELTTLMTTTQECQDHALCPELLKTVPICNHDDTAVLVCPVMCNRCGDSLTTASTPVATTMTDSCSDVSDKCAYLSKALRVCDVKGAAEKMGCLKTCKKCGTPATSSSTELSLNTQHVITRTSADHSVTTNVMTSTSTTVPLAVTTQSSYHTTTMMESASTEIPSCLPDVPKGGKEYIFMYEKNVLPTLSSLQMLIAANHTGWITRTDTGDVTQCTNTTINPGKTLIDIPNSFQLENNKLENKGIHFVTSGDVVMHGLFRDPSVTDGFLVLPVNELSTDYVVPSYDPSGIFQSFVAIVGTQPGTEVSIHLRINRPFDYNSRTYNDGDVLKINLERLQTLEFADDIDFTGTRIHGNKPIAVESGSQCANVPKDIGTCNHLLEMIPPVTSLGTEYVVPPLNAEKGYLVRVISTSPNTTVDINNIGLKTSKTLMKNGDFIEIPVGGRIPIFLKSSKPVLVARYGEGAVAPGEPYLTIIPSIEQYKKSYSFVIPDLPNFVHSVSITILQVKTQCLRIDGQYPSNQAYPSYDNQFPYVVVELQISPGFHHVTCDDQGTKFGVTIFGISNENSYGYPANL